MFDNLPLVSGHNELIVVFELHYNLKMADAAFAYHRVSNRDAYMLIDFEQIFFLLEIIWAHIVFAWQASTSFWT